MYKDFWCLQHIIRTNVENVLDKSKDTFRKWPIHQIGWVLARHYAGNTVWVVPFPLCEGLFINLCNTCQKANLWNWLCACRKWVQSGFLFIKFAKKCFRFQTVQVFSDWRLFKIQYEKEYLLTTKTAATLTKREEWLFGYICKCLREEIVDSYVYRFWSLY